MRPRIPFTTQLASESAVPTVRTGFARADDGRQLHWRALGSGPPIVCCNGVGVSTFFWKYLANHLRDRFTVLLWDYRGHGRSSRDLAPYTDDLSVPRHADDCAAVLDSAGVDAPAVAIGHSMGCQVVLELRRRHPERVSALVMMLGTAGRALETFFDYPGSPRIMRAVDRLARAAGPAINDIVHPWLESPLAWHAAIRLSLVDPYYTRRADLVPYLEHLNSLDLRVFLQAVLALQTHDAWDTLGDLDRPLLVVAAENDQFTPMWCSEKIVRSAPGSELLVLADGSHAALIEQPETINYRIDRFLRDRLDLG
jgi:pimeloyl-ACP methyl ester carboxylesterase